MLLATAIVIHGYGTSEGVIKEWDTRGRGRKPRTKVENLNRSKIAKQSYVKVTSEKIKNAAQSVQQLAAALGTQPTANSHPFDILYKGTKVGIEVKRFEPGRKHLKATVHSGATLKTKDKGKLHNQGSKARKLAFADKTGMQRMYLVVHDMHDPSNVHWYARRMGDKGDPRSDPKDPRTGWSYNTRAMKEVSSPEELKGVIK